MLCCQVQQVAARWQQHEAMERRSKPQQRLVLSAERWQQCRYGADELLVNGHMYDVVSTSRHGNEVTLTVVCDDDEGEILATIKKLLKGSKEDGSSVPDELVNLLCAAYIIPDGYHILPLWHGGTSPLLQHNVALLAGQDTRSIRPPQLSV